MPIQIHMKTRFVLILSVLLIATSAAPALAAGKVAKVEPQTKQTGTGYMPMRAPLAVHKWSARAYGIHSPTILP